MGMQRKALRIAFALACSASALLSLATIASAAETWRFATKMPADSPEGKVFQYFADKVGEYSKGDLKVQVYPSEQLGKEAAILEQLELGTIQLYAEDAFFLQKWVPDIKYISPPFMFKSRETWKKFVNTDLVKGWFAQVEKTAGIRPLGDPTAIVRGPYRVIISKKPLKSYTDFKGMQLRMYPDKLAIAVWSYLGADLRMLGWTDTYEGIKSGIATAVTSPAALVESMRFYEVAPNIAVTNEFWQGIPFSMNAEQFDKLSPANKEALLKAHADAGKFSAEMMDTASLKMKQSLQERGVTFTDLDLDPLFDHMDQWYATEDAAGRLPKGLWAAAQTAKKN